MRRRRGQRDVAPREYRGLDRPPLRYLKDVFARAVVLLDEIECPVASALWLKKMGVSCAETTCFRAAMRTVKRTVPSTDMYSVPPDQEEDSRRFA